ncbi:MAG: B12-binding domain-containing radical SAM protein [Nitrospirota bacterium]
MNILLISTNRNNLPMPVMPIGACMVAEACERAGHSVTLLDLMFGRDPLDEVQNAVRSLRPDVVGLSVRNIDNNDMRDTVFFLDDLLGIMNTVREHTDAPVILGGAALAVMPEAILRFSGASCAVLGDGESVFPALLERIASGASFAGMPGIAALDQAAFFSTACSGSNGTTDCGAPEYSRWLDRRAYRSQLATAPLQTKLGCAFQCVYCTYRKIEGNGHRLADPGSVAEAVTRLAASGHRDIELVDSVFNAPYDHARQVCEALAKVKHGARLQSLELNPRAFDDALVTSMEQAGFAGMGLTVESASDRVLEHLRKGFTSREVNHAAEVVRRHDLPCAWIFLLGGPGETEDTVRETLRFAETRVRPQDVVFFNIGVRIYPGTELESIARTQGVLSAPAAEMLRPVFYLSPEIDAEKTMHEVRRAMGRNMNFINTDSIGLSILPAVHRIGARLGVRPPLWRHTRFIRRALRFAGMDV